MQIHHIAGYKFTNLDCLAELQQDLLAQCQLLDLKGTILLSHEGINLNLAGLKPLLSRFQTYLKEKDHFQDMTFRESFAEKNPYKRLKVKIKKEIITLRNPAIRPEEQRAPNIQPEILKKWLDEKRDFYLLDTRNDYEYRFGSFKDAIHLKMNDFSEFPSFATQLDCEKPIVMFCTGGIRCEKAGLHLLNENFPEVYQLEGGILNYFATVGHTHFQGECFVFDERVALNSELKPTGTVICRICHGPATDDVCKHCIHHLTP